MADVIQMLNRKPGDLSPRPALLIVDDDRDWRRLARDLCEQALAEDNVVVLDCDSVSGALEILSSQPVHAVILDKNLGQDSDNPFHNGIASIPRLLSVQDHLQIVTATSSEEIQDVEQAILNGACSYVVKHKNMKYFEAAVKRALSTGLRLYLTKIGAEPIEEGAKTIALPGRSPATMQLRLRVHEAAKTEAPVVLLGESGTGKSTVAKLLHLLRSQYVGKNASDRPFIRINMGAIPENLAESEFFGHEEGAFTGAKKMKFGALERARGGTLFLDEIGEAPLALQVKLLTALDEKKFFRVGGEKEVRSEFRLICATNRNLEQLVKEGKFREDLYRRIAILEIKVPSVRERKDDIIEIIRAVLPKCCRESRIQVDLEDIPKDFIAKIIENPPIGNIGGIEQQIIRLLAHAPRDRKDRPILKQWRSIQELKINAGEVTDIPNRPITLDEIGARFFDVVGQPGFQGITSFIRIIEKKLYEDARRRFGTDYGSTKKVARAFGITDSVVSRKFIGFEMVRSGRHEKPKMTEEDVHERSNEIQ